jgi:hypothetical protein
VIKVEEIRVGNSLYRVGQVCEVDYGTIKLCQQRNVQFNLDYKAIPVSKEILVENLGFICQEAGGFEMYSKGDFIISRFTLMPIKAPFTFIISSSIKEPLNFQTVHHLQNTYLDLKGEQLLWQ